MEPLRPKLIKVYVLALLVAEKVALPTKHYLICWHMLAM